MKQRDSVSPRQFTAAVFVSALSLLIRRFPRALALRAGRGAVLAVPLSALPMLAALAVMGLLFRRRGVRGLSDVFTALLGKAAGRVLTGLYGLWFVFYAGFLLRAGAERFLSTVYTGAQPWVFVCVMALLCALAAAGRLLPLTRAAMLFRPLMLGLIVLISLLTAKDLDLSLLQPLRTVERSAVAASALEIASLCSIAVFLSFSGGSLERPLRTRDWAPWLAVLLGVIALMTVGCLCMFGPELTANMRYPYFMLVRDLTVLGALERLEPVVVALWVFSDFILISLLLHLAAGNVRFCLRPGRPRSAGGLLAALFAAAAAAVALALPGSLSALNTLSEHTVPTLCALLAFGPLPPLLVIGILRKKL